MNEFQVEQQRKKRASELDEEERRIVADDVEEFLINWDDLMASRTIATDTDLYSDAYSVRTVLAEFLEALTENLPKCPGCPECGGMMDPEDDEEDEE